jgi:hypothetical protein
MILNTQFERQLNSAILPYFKRFEPVAVEEDGVKVEYDWMGEGDNGDYQPDNPEDKPLLRFTVYQLKGATWHPVEDSSNITLLPITTSEEILGKLARYILNIVKNHVLIGRKIKGECERLSWISEGVLETE